MVLYNGLACGDLDFIGRPETLEFESAYIQRLDIGRVGSG